MGECDFPNCPSGYNGKLFDERHKEVKKSLDDIKGGQVEINKTMTNVATLLADVANMKKDLEENNLDHDDLFRRMRHAEAKQAWILGVAAAVVFVVGLLIKIL